LRWEYCTVNETVVEDLVDPTQYDYEEDYSWYEEDYS